MALFRPMERVFLEEKNCCGPFSSKKWLAAQNKNEQEKKFSFEKTEKTEKMQSAQITFLAPIEDHPLSD